MRLAGVRSIPQGLLSGLSETIVAGAAGVLLAGNIQKNVVYRFFHRWIVCQGLVPEAGGVSVGQFFSNSLEIPLGITKFLLLAAGIGHSAHQFLLPGHLLLTQVVAIQIPLIIPWSWGTPQAKSVTFCLRNKPVDAVVF